MSLSGHIKTSGPVCNLTKHCNCSICYVKVTRKMTVLVNVLADVQREGHLEKFGLHLIKSNNVLRLVMFLFIFKFSSYIKGLKKNPSLKIEDSLQNTSGVDHH